MALTIEHNVDRATVQLLSAPLDLQLQTDISGSPKSQDKATTAHKLLYADYLQAFPEIYEAAEIWWTGCIQAHISQGETQEDAQELAFSRRISGAASYPPAVLFFRTFWLRCDELNVRLPIEDRIPPQTLMLQWLVDDQKTDFVTLLTCMPYWPMGLDADGRWC